MSTSILCRLCLTKCSDHINLYDANGLGTRIYKMTCSYFHPNILNMNVIKQKAVICLKCWQRIRDFQLFRLSVLMVHVELSKHFQEVIRKTTTDEGSFHKIKTDRIISSDEEEHLKAYNLNVVKIEDTRLEYNKSPLNVVEKVQDIRPDPLDCCDVDIKKAVKEEDKLLIQCKEEETRRNSSSSTLTSKLCCAAGNSSENVSGKDSFDNSNKSPANSKSPNSKGVSFLESLLETNDDPQPMKSSTQEYTKTTTTTSAGTSSKSPTPKKRSVPTTNSATDDKHPDILRIRNRYHEITQMADHLKAEGVLFLESLINTDENDEIPWPLRNLNQINPTSNTSIPNPTTSHGSKETTSHFEEFDEDLCRAGESDDEMEIVSTDEYSQQNNLDTSMSTSSEKVLTSAIYSISTDEISEVNEKSIVQLGKEPKGNKITSQPLDRDLNLNHETAIISRRSSSTTSKSRTPSTCIDISSSDSDEEGDTVLLQLMTKIIGSEDNDPNDEEMSDSDVEFISETTKTSYDGT